MLFLNKLVIYDLVNVRSVETAHVAYSRQSEKITDPRSGRYDPAVAVVFHFINTVDVAAGRSKSDVDVQILIDLFERRQLRSPDRFQDLFRSPHKDEPGVALDRVLDRSVGFAGAASSDDEIKRKAELLDCRKI